MRAIDAEKHLGRTVKVAMIDHYVYPYFGTLVAVEDKIVVIEHDTHDECIELVDLDYFIFV